MATFATQDGFVRCSGAAVSRTVTLGSLCMQSCCTGSVLWVWLMALSMFGLL